MKTEHDLLEALTRIEAHLTELEAKIAAIPQPQIHIHPQTPQVSLPMSAMEICARYGHEYTHGVWGNIPTPCRRCGSPASYTITSNTGATTSGYLSVQPGSSNGGTQGTCESQQWANRG